MGKPKMTVLYVYPDKHGVAVFEQHHAASGKHLQWVEVYEKVVDYIHWHGTSQFPKNWKELSEEEKTRLRAIEDRDREGFRLIVRGDSIPLVMKAHGLDVWDNNHSDANDERGITVRTVHVYMGGNKGGFTMDSVYLHGKPVHETCVIQVPSREDGKFGGKLNAGDKAPTFEEHASKSEWSDYKVAKVHRVTKPAGQPS
jgi:hypothetical protein